MLRVPPALRSPPLLPAQPPVRAQNSWRCLFLVVWHFKRYLCSCLLLQLISSFTNPYFMGFYPPPAPRADLFSAPADGFTLPPLEGRGAPGACECIRPSHSPAALYIYLCFFFLSSELAVHALPG